MTYNSKSAQMLRKVSGKIVWSPETGWIDKPKPPTNPQYCCAKCGKGFDFGCKCND